MPPPPPRDPEKKLLSEMGARMAAYRHRKRWTQSELGHRVARRQETISRWENGMVEPTVLEVVALCRVLGCTLDELVRGRSCP